MTKIYFTEFKKKCKNGFKYRTRMDSVPIRSPSDVERRGIHASRSSIDQAHSTFLNLIIPGRKSYKFKGHLILAYLNFRSNTRHCLHTSENNVINGCYTIQKLLSFFSSLCKFFNRSLCNHSLGGNDTGNFSFFLSFFTHLSV